MNLFKSEIDYSRAIIEMTQGLILLLDTEGRIRDCNIHMEELSGCSSAQIIGRRWRDILLPVDGKAFPRGYFRNIIARKRNAGTAVYRMVTEAGSDLYLEFNFRVTKDRSGNFSGVLVVGYDVTELVKYERRLEKERFNLIERNKELTCLNRISKMANDEGTDLDRLLQSTGELIPPALQFTDIAGACIRLDDRSFPTAGYRASGLILSEPIIIQGEWRGRLDISYLPSEKTDPAGTVAFLDEERHLAQAVAHHLSLIIEKREADEKKLELEQQLRHADRLATIGQLAAGVAHELNEPLGNILGFAQLSNRLDGLPDQLYMDLSKIVKASLHAREIIKKLMLFGRRMPRQEMVVSLDKIVEDGLYFLESRCAKSGIALNKSAGADLPMIKGDPSQLEQVLVNLVINAIHAMPAGGVLTIETFGEADRVKLRVADTGTGIEDDVLPQIFVPFFTTKDVDEGTGLGLSVVHGIVTAHSGAIDVETEAGKGTAFTVSIPAADGE